MDAIYNPLYTTLLSDSYKGKRSPGTKFNYLEPICWVLGSIIGVAIFFALFHMLRRRLAARQTAKKDVEAQAGRRRDGSLLMLQHEFTGSAITLVEVMPQPPRNVWIRVDQYRSEETQRDLVHGPYRPRVGGRYAQAITIH